MVNIGSAPTVSPKIVLDEEKRLFYVAMTRAEHCLYVLTERGKESPYLDALNYPFIPRYDVKQFRESAFPRSTFTSKIQPYCLAK